MTTFKTHLQLRAEIAKNTTTLANNGQVVCESREELEKLQSRLAHSRRNTLTDRAYTRR